MSGTVDPAAAAPAAPAADPAAAAPAAPADGATLLTAAPATADIAKQADPAAAPAETPKVEAPVVPEKYEFVAPEGVQLDPAAIEAFTPIAKDLKLTNEQAQKLVDLHATQQKAAIEAHVARVTAWAEAAKADPEYGGVNFAANVGAASKAIDKFGTPGLRSALDESGLGNHPDVVRFFVKVGKSMAEDTMTSGAQGGGGAPRTAAEILYPSHPK